MATRKEEQVQRDYLLCHHRRSGFYLIDEARTPLIISGPVPVSRQMYDELKEWRFGLGALASATIAADWL